MNLTVFQPNSVATKDLQPFNCRILENNLVFNDTFVCTSFNALNNDQDNITFAFGMSFRDANLEFFVRDVRDPKRLLLNAASINESTSGIKLNECDYKTNGMTLARYKSSECPRVGPVCANTLGFGTKGALNDIAAHPYQMWSMLSTESGQFDDTLTKLSIRLFNYTAADATKKLCATIAQSAVGSKASTPFDVNDAAALSSPSNFFRGIKTNLCQRYFDTSTYTCSYLILESRMEHVLRVSGYLLFVQLVIGFVVVSLKIYYVKRVEKADDSSDDENNGAGKKTKEFQSARM